MTMQTDKAPVRALARIPTHFYITLGAYRAVSRRQSPLLAPRQFRNRIADSKPGEALARP